jgi:hypothetical protein
LIKKLANYLDDILLVLGCACILYGLVQISVIAAWIVGGMMLAGFGYLIGRAKASHAVE